MKKITYHKLVRDRIPEIIEQSGRTCTYSILTDEEYLGQYPAFMRFGENWFSLQGFYDEHPFRFLIEDLNPEYEDLGPLYESAG